MTYDDCGISAQDLIDIFDNAPKDCEHKNTQRFDNIVGADTWSKGTRLISYVCKDCLTITTTKAHELGDREWVL